MKAWTVGYVFMDEPTPRDEHATTVKASDAEEAKLHAWADKAKNGERIMVTGVMTSSK